MAIDKTKFKDLQGRPLTQSLFLEIGYNTDFAVYTLDDEDKEYKGVIYPSLKRLYLESRDPTEYSFATRHLLNWKHWQRMNDNKVLARHFEDWREELEVLITSEAIERILDLSLEDKGFQAAKFLADRGWRKRGAGRPSKEEIAREVRVSAKILDFENDDYDRLETANG